MSTSTPTRPGPIAPPDEQFWEKYSPHYEFPLSSVGSVALHVGVLVLIGLLLWAAMRPSDKVPVPMVAMTVSSGDDDGGPGKMGSGGGDPQEAVDPTARPMLPSVPDADLRKVEEEIQPFLPKVPSVEEGLRPEDLDAVPKIARLTEDLRKQLQQGAGSKKGTGKEPGTGNSDQPGDGSNTAGDAKSSQNRAVRWELIFKTANGKDYVAQLAAMKATLVIPQPADWTTLKSYTNIGGGSPTVGAFNRDELPGLYFIDDAADSAAKVAEAIGLTFSPPRFIAFFPKEVEEELAAKEREHRGRKESEIFSTTFKILIREGKYTIQVTDQKPVKR